MIGTTMRIPWHLRCQASQLPLTEAVILSPCGHEINESSAKTAKVVTGALRQCPVLDCPHGIVSYQRNESKCLSARKYVQTYEDSRYFLSMEIPLSLSCLYPGIRGQFRGDGLILQSHNGSLVNMLVLSKKDEYSLVLGLRGDGNEFCHFLAVQQIPYKKLQPNGIDYVVEIEGQASMRKVINILSYENDLPDGYAEYVLSAIT